jgi:hypothetical protein
MKGSDGLETALESFCSVAKNIKLAPNPFHGMGKFSKSTETSGLHLSKGNVPRVGKSVLLKIMILVSVSPPQVRKLVG